jgi:hypothetical protein
VSRELDAAQVWEILRFRILNSQDPDEVINRLVEDWARQMNASEDLKSLFRSRLVSIACQQRNENRTRH